MWARARADLCKECNVRVLGCASSMIWLPLQHAIFTSKQRWACAYCVFHVAVRDGLDLITAASCNVQHTGWKAGSSASQALLYTLDEGPPAFATPTKPDNITKTGTPEVAKARLKECARIPGSCYALLPGARALAGQPDEAGLLRAGIAHVLLAQLQPVNMLLLLCQPPPLREQRLQPQRLCFKRGQALPAGAMKRSRGSAFMWQPFSRICQASATSATQTVT